MSAKHTPGPWHYADSMGDREIRSSVDITIGEVLGDGNSYCQEEEEERLANAQLIAAAPDMLEALESEEAWRRETDELKASKLRGHAWTLRTQALAKAKGETP